jgi:acyl-CoA synthetase (AMP-forming)/AMP-acid ligase II
MVHAYRRAGGLVSSDEVALLLRRRTAQPISLLARWIVARNVVSFEWQLQTLVPLFQFDLSDMSLRCGTAEVIEELSGAFDDWDLARWFAQPNSWLRNAAPVDVIDADQPAVMQAARADRYIARG